MISKKIIILVAALCVVCAYWIGLKRHPDREVDSQKPGTTSNQTILQNRLRARRLGPVLPPAIDEAPNVLIIAIDNIRADRMSCYGGPRATTPNLDALARRGTRFARCVAQAPYTPHSFSSMLSSLYVADLEVRVRARPTGDKETRRAGLEPYNIALAEVMRDAGYATSAVVMGWFTEAFGLTQGFEWVSYERRRLPAVASATLEWIRRWHETDRDRPFFMFSYSLDVHYEFMKNRSPGDHIFGGQPGGFNIDSSILKQYRKGEISPSSEEIQNALTLYEEGLYWTDHEIQRLLDGLDEMGLLDKTIIVLVSDHGEEFNEHGYLSHGQSNFATVVDVPLIVVDPRYEGSRVIQQRVMNIDIMPTILDLCGIPIPETAKGLSLAPSVRGEPQPELEDRIIYSEGAWNGFVGTVYAGSYKYLKGKDDRVYLFDLSADPKEKYNLAIMQPDLTVRLEEMLFRHKRDGLATQILLKLQAPLELNKIALPDQESVWATLSVLEENNARPILSDESMKDLKALGYLR